jgi:hypothetical protein
MVAEGEEWARSFRHDTTEERHSVRRAQSKRAHQSNLEVTIAPSSHIFCTCPIHQKTMPIP